MLLINNNRSKAYLQNILLNGLMPAKVILLNDQNIKLPEHTDNDIIISRETNQKFIRKIKELDIGFDEKEHVLKTLDSNHIDYVIINSIDVNSEEVISEVKKLNSGYVIYSGPGGTILKNDILNSGKKFIHVHPGLLPKYRGSTTLYYSILINSSIGASVILMNEEIDQGTVLLKREYLISDKNIDFDYSLDPLIRAKALIEFLKINKIKKKEQKESDESYTFYIIHPLIKHAAILSQ